MHHSRQLCLPYKEKKLSGFIPTLQQAYKACGQFFGQVDIDHLRNLSSNLSTPLINWLTAGRKEVITLRKHAFSVHGKGAFPLLVGYEIANHARKVSAWLHLPSKAPLPIRAFARTEKLGALGVTALSVLCITLTGNPTSIELPLASSAEAAPIIVTAPIFPVLSTRPEVGVYADPQYRYPHQRIAMGPSAPVKVSFASLKGEKANSGWYARYIGVPMGIVPQEAVVDPLAQHTRMFAVKFNPEASWEVQPVALTMDEQYAEMYNTQRTHMTLPQFVAGVQTVMNETKAAINWEKLCADSRISLAPQQCLLLRQVTDQITPEMLVTYGMTELFPRELSRTHDFNRRILEHGLINYGREFWDLAPAQSDGLASAGLWQLTSFAVGAYTDEKGNPQVGGATIVGRHLINRPPESFLNFKRTHHEQAAYLFAVHNIALLIREAAKKPHALNTIRKVWVTGDRQSELLQYIATAHHAPNGVKNMAYAWLRAGAVKPYQDYLRGRFVEYARRTRLNWPSMAPVPASSAGERS